MLAGHTYGGATWGGRVSSKIFKRLIDFIQSSDTATIKANISEADQLSYDEILSTINAFVGIGDDGQGADTIPDTKILIGLRDSAKLIDKATLIVATALLDTIISHDEIDIVQVKTLTDTGLSDELITTIQAFIEAKDRVKYSDILASIQNQIKVTDITQATELIELLSKVTINDTGVGIDSASKASALIGISDEVDYNDIIREVKSCLGITDEISATDTIDSIVKRLLVADSAEYQGVVGIIKNYLSVADDITHEDVIDIIKGKLSVSDEVTSYELTEFKKILEITDEGTLTDEAIIVAGILLTEAITSQEAQGILASIGIIDLGESSEDIAKILHILVSDHNDLLKELVAIKLRDWIHCPYKPKLSPYKHCQNEKIL